MTDIPREEFGDLLHGMVGDAGDDVAEIGFGFEVVHFGGFDDRVDCGGTFTASVGTGEEPVFATHGQGRMARSAALLLISSLPSVV